eukprot:scaffold13698_cov69-Cylindrotheca_fusiformis.AAC.1
MCPSYSKCLMAHTLERAIPLKLTCRIGSRTEDGPSSSFTATTKSPSSFFSATKTGPSSSFTATKKGPPSYFSATKLSPLWRFCFRILPPC